MLTENKIEKICRYASGVYYRNYEQWALNNETYEDFKQSLLCLALEYPEDSFIMLVRRYKYLQMCSAEEIPLKIRNMTTFSQLTQNVEDSEQLIETVGGEYNPFDKLEYNNVVYAIAKRLYKESNRRELFIELFLDYMNGQSIGGSRQRDVRNKLFKNRFEILKVLLFFGVITRSYYIYLLRVANEMTKPCSAKKGLNMTSSAIACRKYYEKNKEKIKEKHKKDRLVKKNEKLKND